MSFSWPLIEQGSRRKLAKLFSLTSRFNLRRPVRFLKEIPCWHLQARCGALQCFWHAHECGEANDPSLCLGLRYKSFTQVSSMRLRGLLSFMSQEEALMAKKVAEEEAAKYKAELHRVSDARILAHVCVFVSFSFDAMPFTFTPCTLAVLRTGGCKCMETTFGFCLC